MAAPRGALRMRARLPTRLLLAGGVAGPILFVVAVLAQDLTRPDYDAARQFISVLGLGDLGWVQGANFVASGLLIAGFGVGLRRRAAVRRSAGLAVAPWIPPLVALTGTALAVAGLFPSDPQLGYPTWISAAEVANPTLHSRIHFAAGFVATAAFAAAIMLGAVTAARERAAARSAHALLSVATMLGCFLAGLALESPGIGVPAIGGLLQRIGLVAGLQWLVVLAWTCLRFGADAPATAAVGATSTGRRRGLTTG